MPLIRYTYDRDIARYGAEPIEVPAVVARVQVVQRRRAEMVWESPDSPTAAVPGGDCGRCPLGECGACEPVT